MGVAKDSNICNKTAIGEIAKVGNNALRVVTLANTVKGSFATRPLAHINIPYALVRYYTVSKIKDPYGFTNIVEVKRLMQGIKIAFRLNMKLKALVSKAR